ncbi:MAG: biotin synthase BioB, partial [Candidatus Binatia bacterium]
QSAISTAPIDKYRLLSPEQLLAGARKAAAAGARRYCMVTSGRGPSDRDIEHLSEATRAIKSEFPTLEICLSLGLMNEGQARLLKAAGVGWVNHNLNTSRRFYPEICTTHTYDDRVETVQNVKRAGLSTCSGGILGMGENDEDIIELSYTVRALEIDSIPVNFLHPIAGTPLGERRDFAPTKGLKALCLMRFLNPRSEIRMSAGRELYLGSWGGLALYPANSIFVEGYLTTPGQQATEAQRLIEEAGFEVEPIS